MKNLIKAMHRSVAVITLMAVIVVFVGCPIPGGPGPDPGIPPGESPDKPNAILIDMRSITAADLVGWESSDKVLDEFDFVLVGNDVLPMLFSVDEDSLPTKVVTKNTITDPDHPSFGETLDIGMTFEDGRPSVMEFNGYGIYFFNYDEYSFDMAIVPPEGETEYHYNIETDTNWDTFADDIKSGKLSTPMSVSPSDSGRSASGRSAIDNALNANSLALEIISQGLAIASCVLALYFPPAGIGCLLNALSSVVNFTLMAIDWLLGPDWKTSALGVGANLADILADAFGCLEVLIPPADATSAIIKCMEIGQILDCVSLATTLVTMAVDAFKDFLAKKNEVVKVPDVTKHKVNFNVGTGTGKINTMEVLSGARVKLPDQGNLTNGNKEFKGWSKTAGGTYSYTGGTEYPHEITKDTTFYAVWSVDPVKVTAVEQSINSVKVSWTDPKLSPPASRYDVYRYENDYSQGPNTRINEKKVSVGSSTFTFTDTTVSPDTEYWYVIKAFRNGPSTEIGGASVKTHAITYTALPNNATNTTAINLRFSSAVSGLSAGDINIHNETGKAAKGTLTGSGTSYSLGISVETAGSIRINISKKGVSSELVTLTVGKTTSGGATTYTATANNAGNTTAINLAFSAAVSGLSANDITLTNGTGSVTKGALTGSGTSYSLAVTVATAGTVTVKITKSGIESANKTVTVGKGASAVPLEMVYVPGGSFEMGQNGDGTSGNVTPVHTVTLTGFYIGKYEVTQAQWQAVMGTTIEELQTAAYPNITINYGRGENYPVYYVNWCDALVFCNKLSIAEGLTPAYRISDSTDPTAWGNVPTSSDATWNAATIVSGSTGYRLPTEAQWEYAAKGGNGSPGNYIYAGSDTVEDVAWYSGNNGASGSATYGSKAVGTKAPNGLGIYDMSGNVFEWCWDWYGGYQSTAQTDPVGASSSSGSYRVYRGGYWVGSADNARSAYRVNVNPNNRSSAVGFRLVRPGN